MAKVRPGFQWWNIASFTYQSPIDCQGSMSNSQRGEEGFSLSWSSISWEASPSLKLKMLHKWQLCSSFWQVSLKYNMSGMLRRFIEHWWKLYRLAHTVNQCLCQDLETVKLAELCKICGRPNFAGGSQYTHISTINMYKFIKIRHDIIKQCHGNYKEMKEFNNKLEIEIFRNSTLKRFGVLRGSF